MTVNSSIFVLLVLVAASAGNTQSGRKLKVVKPTPPNEVVQPTQPTQPGKADESLPVTAEKREFYRCSDDGSLARILTDDEEPTFTTKQVDTRATILSRPAPGYTREARRNSVQGLVVLNVVLAADGTIGRVGVVRGLPAGLTESAMRAACKIKFKPAIKDGKSVSQRVLVEYVFRVSGPSILNPKRLT